MYLTSKSTFSKMKPVEIQYTQYTITKLYQSHSHGFKLIKAQVINTSQQKMTPIYSGCEDEVSEVGLVGEVVSWMRCRWLERLKSVMRFVRLFRVTWLVMSQRLMSDDKFCSVQFIQVYQCFFWYHHLSQAERSKNHSEWLQEMWNSCTSAFPNTRTWEQQE